MAERALQKLASDCTTPPLCLLPHPANESALRPGVRFSADVNHATGDAKLDAASAPSSECGSSDSGHTLVTLSVSMESGLPATSAKPLECTPVRGTGLEPAHLAVPDPKSGASAIPPSSRERADALSVAGCAARLPSCQECACRPPRPGSPLTPMALSSRTRKFMQLWVVLGGLMFFARCFDQAQPYLRVILGQPRNAEHASPTTPSRPR